MEQSYDVVIVGAGIAGLTAASSARECNPDSSILLINGEDRPPYNRPQLSKVIADGFKDGAILLRDENWYQQQRIELLHSTVQQIDPRGKMITISDGQSIAYRSLVLATGSEPKYPPIIRQHERGSFFVVRSASDAEELRAATKKAKAILVAGMGVLALEVTDQLRKMGKNVTLAGAAPQLMPRQLNVRAGELMEQVLSEKKVRLLFQEEILSFEQNKKGKWSVSLLKHQGHYDLVVFCIGVKPRTDLAKGAGIELGRGIKVDDRFQTSEESIYAAGDVAELADGHMSILWRESQYQGMIAGANAAGCEKVRDARPFPLVSRVFGQFVFSCNRPANPWDYEIDDFDFKDRYYALYWLDGQLHGAVMINDEPNSEVLEQAIQEHWDREKVMERFELS